MNSNYIPRRLKVDEFDFDRLKLYVSIFNPSRMIVPSPSVLSSEAIGYKESCCSRVTDYIYKTQEDLEKILISIKDECFATDFESHKNACTGLLIIRSDFKMSNFCKKFVSQCRSFNFLVLFVGNNDIVIENAL